MTAFERICHGLKLSPLSANHRMLFEAALDEAAKVCREKGRGWGIMRSVEMTKKSDAAKECAEAIDALKTAKPEVCDEECDLAYKLGCDCRHSNKPEGER
jgi:hypothetical protein